MSNLWYNFIVSLYVIFSYLVRKSYLAINFKKKGLKMLSTITNFLQNLDIQGNENNIAGFVIDTSICGIQNQRELFERLIEACDKSGLKIILTTVTIDELDLLQKRNIENSQNARNILNSAVNDSLHFKAIEVDKEFALADDCILNFCNEHKKSVALLTADKAMYLKANAKGIQTCYFYPPPYIQNPIRTLYYTKKEGDRLLIAPTFDPISTAVRIVSDTFEYDILKSREPYELHIGDNVFIAKSKKNYVSFYHFRMISLNDTINCIVKYHKRIYSMYDIELLPQGNYKSFINDFLSIRGLNLQN